MQANEYTSDEAGPRGRADARVRRTAGIRRNPANSGRVHPPGIGTGPGRSGMPGRHPRGCPGPTVESRNTGRPTSTFAGLTSRCSTPPGAWRPARRRPDAAAPVPGRRSAPAPSADGPDPRRRCAASPGTAGRGRHRNPRWAARWVIDSSGDPGLLVELPTEIRVRGPFVEGDLDGDHGAAATPVVVDGPVDDAGATAPDDLTQPIPPDDHVIEVACADGDSGVVGRHVWDASVVVATIPAPTRCRAGLRASCPGALLSRE